MHRLIWPVHKPRDITSIQLLVEDLRQEGWYTKDNVDNRYIPRADATIAKKSLCCERHGAVVVKESFHWQKRG
jgi:hypothetical protein